jgi:hypothetical protein
LLPINVFKLTHLELLPRNGWSLVGNRFLGGREVQNKSP